MVRRDASGNFIVGTITANLLGNVTGNLTGSASNNVLKAGDNGSPLTMANQSSVRFSEQTGNGTEYVALQASASMPSSYYLILSGERGVRDCFFKYL